MFGIIKRKIERVKARRAKEADLMQKAATIDASKEGSERIVADFKSLQVMKGLKWDEYFQFEFEKRNEEFRKSFLGLHEQRYYLDYLNPKKYCTLARNKFLAHKVLENTGVRMSTLYCHYQPEARFPQNNERADDLEGVLRILKSRAVQSCVIKATEGFHGDSVQVIEKIAYGDNDAVLTRYDGVEVSLSSVLGENELIFESVVRQTPMLASWNATSVNTVRFMTTLWPDGSARVIAAFLKIGRSGRCVDNAGAGGNVDACVDLSTGEIKHAIQFNGWRNIVDIDKHPDSGVQLNGVVIEHWEEIKEEVKRFQQAFPYCKAAGWDIAITDDGPVVIEVNDFWDTTGQFFIRRGWRKEIRDCYLAWKATGKEYGANRYSNALSKERLEKLVGIE